MLRNSLLLFSAAIAWTAAGQPAMAQMINPPSVPANLRVPEGNTPFLRGSAMGTQNYVCLPAASGLAWQFQAPQATIFVTFRWFTGEIRQQVMTHFLSPNPMEGDTPRPTWQSSIDTSAVWGKKIAESSDPAYVAAGAIPWLLLQAAGGQQGPTGGTLLSRSTFIQRVNTTGGTITGTACTQAGAIKFVPYTAEYVFYQSSALYAWAKQPDSFEFYD